MSSNDSSPSLSLQASAWLASFSFEQLPADIVASTKLRILDVIGNTVAATRSSFGVLIREAGLAMSAGGPARLIGFGDEVSAPVAALVNGSLATAFDFDDTHTETLLHFSSPTVLTAFALAPRAAARDLIVAVACGSELMCRLGMCAPGAFHRRGFHATGILGTVGAACTASRVLHLSAEQTAHAIGIAGAQAAGLTQAQTEGTASRLMYAGFAAQAGLMAALLAESGIDGPARILEDERGLFPTHVADVGESGLKAFAPPDGREWETRRSSFKPFPCGHVIHPFIQAALGLRSAHLMNVQGIRSVVCHVPPYAIPLVCEPAARRQAPADGNDARMCLQYTIAETLCLGALDGNSYQAASLANPTILGVARKTSYVADPAFSSRQRFGGKLVITMQDGTEFSRTEPVQLGSPELPFGPEDVRRKFTRNLEGSQLAASASQIIDMVDRFEHLDRIEDLVALCCRPSEGRASPKTDR